LFYAHFIEEGRNKKKGFKRGLAKGRGLRGFLPAAILSRMSESPGPLREKTSKK